MYVEAHITIPIKNFDRIIPRCILRPDRNNEVQIPINNLTLTDIKIDRKETISRAEKCEENSHEDGTIMQVLNVEVTYRPYRLGHYERLRVREQIEELKIARIVEDLCSEYASPILIVRKKNGDKRICIDYRRLNSIVKTDKYPLRLVDDQLDRLDGKRYFTSLDLKSAYYQMPLQQESRDRTAFVTPDGHYQFTPLPFGLVNGPAVFQRMINRVLGVTIVVNGPAVFQRMINRVLGPLRFTIVMAFMDDLLISSASTEEGLQNLEEVLKVMQKARLTLNPNKCSLFGTQIEYPGFKIEVGRIQPGSRKVQCIRDFPEPQSIHEVRQFLGLTSYFRRFIRDHGLTTKSLTNLLRKNGMWTWGQKEQEAFDTLKRELCENPVVMLYSQSAPIEVHTDACKNGLSGVMLQSDQSGQWHPVIDLVPRIGRWWLKMLEFQFEVEHRSAERMRHVDGLSRNPLPQEEETECVEGIQLLTVELEKETSWS
ncbi:RNase H-like domain found in reverse transcriptase [Popillia japonica]|uniref:RNase H-like domain found in reverse transcriptase n=1 Tax=Popillia japonica TaxID=7064 RepID=A0AAW1LB08_POPJA